MKKDKCKKQLPFSALRKVNMFSLQLRLQQMYVPLGLPVFGLPVLLAQGLSRDTHTHRGKKKVLFGCVGQCICF